jgi:outer membrane protein assembly factor BamB
MGGIRPIGLLLLTSCAAPGGDAAEWGQFRGPDGRGVARDRRPLPAVLDTEHNLLWSQVVPAGLSSPCVAGERLFLTGAEERRLETLCLDRSSGALLWRRAVEVEELERAHRINGAASPTAVSDGERVIAYFGSFGLICYDLDGGEQWRRVLPVAENSFGTAASPIFARGRLIFNRDTNTESFLEAIDPATGETVWRVERPASKSGWSTPAVWRRAGVDELLVYGPLWLRAFDLADGKELWALPGLTDEPCTTPASGEGLVFVTSYNMKTNPEVLGLPSFAELVAEYDRDGDGQLNREEANENDSVLSRFDADGEGDHPLRIFFRFLDADEDGRLSETEFQKLVDWIDGFDFANGLLAVRPAKGGGAAEVAWQHTRGVPECPSPLYYDGRVYMVKNGGIVTCLDARTGELRYQSRIDSRGPCYASPVAGDGKIYTASAHGVITVLAAGDELDILAHNDLGERIMATPALADGVVYVRTESALYAFGG